MYILDTNVISELRKAHNKTNNKANINVINWAKNVPVTSLYLSVISVMELETGVLLIERKDAKQGKALRDWLDTGVLNTFKNRTIAIDTKIAQCCARLHVLNPRSDRDALIAATGITHDMIVVTRNTSDFILTAVKLLNPWEC